MSFLQLISKHTNQKADNPAFQQLEKLKAIPRWDSFKSEPKEINPNEHEQSLSPRKTFLKTRASSVNQKSANKFKEAKSISPSKSQMDYEKRKLPIERRNQQNQVYLKNPLQQTCKVQYHHSFSNYLAKKHIGFRHANNNGRLMYYNLEDIVHKIAIPIKLEPKLEAQDQKDENKQKKSLNLTHYQRFLKQVNHEKNRYHKDQCFQPHDHNKIEKKNSYLNVPIESKNIRPRPKTLWIRPLLRKRQRDEGNIIPWLENQEENSPIRTNNIYSAFRSDNQITQDFSEFLI